MTTNKTPAFLAIGKYRGKPASFVRTYNDEDTLDRDKAECEYFYWVTWEARDSMETRLENGQLSKVITWSFDECNAAKKQLRALLSLHDFKPNK